MTTLTAILATLGAITGTLSWSWILFVHRNPKRPAADEQLTWTALSPAARELISRAARSVAKDYIQEQVEARGLPYTQEAP